MYEDEAVRGPVVLASFVAALAVAAPAHADPSGPDANFLGELNKDGITYQSGPVAISVGKRACSLMDQGLPAADVIKDVASRNPGFTGDGAAKFTAIASQIYCPQHLSDPTTLPPPPPPWFDITLPPLGPAA